MERITERTAKVTDFFTQLNKDAIAALKANLPFVDEMERITDIPQVLKLHSAGDTTDLGFAPTRPLDIAEMPPSSCYDILRTLFVTRNVV